MAELLVRRTPNYNIVGSSPAKKPVGSSKPSHVGYGWRQWCLGWLSCKWVPGYRQRWKLYLDYPWHLEVCEQVCIYTPRGVEQVTDVTGLPGVIICKALWPSFSQEKRYIRTAYYYYVPLWTVQGTEWSTCYSDQAHYMYKLGHQKTCFEVGQKTRPA